MRENEDIRDFMKRVEFAIKLEGFSEDYILQYRRETNWAGKDRILEGTWDYVDLD